MNRACRSDDGELGLQLEDVYFTELTKCHARDHHPTSVEIANCTPYLAEAIRLVRPRVVIALDRNVEAAVTRLTPAMTCVVGLKHPALVQRFLARTNYCHRPLAKVSSSLKKERRLARTAKMRLRVVLVS